MLKKYNIQKGLPALALAKLPASPYVLKPTQHALQKADFETERFHLKEKVTIPLHLDLDNVNIIEIYAEKGNLQRVVCRLEYNYNLDITLSIDPRTTPKTIVTLWLNSKTDNHTTLNLDDFADPNEFELDIE